MVGKVKGGDTVLVTGEAKVIGKEGGMVKRLRVAVPLAGWVNGEKFTVHTKDKKGKELAKVNTTT